MTPRSPRRGLAWLVGAASLALGTVAGAAGPGFEPTVPSDPVFVALLTDGSTVAGRLIRIDPGAGPTLVQADDAERSIAVAELVKLTRPADPAPAGAEGGVVLLAGNDRLARCLVGAASDTALRVQTPALGPLAIPLDSLAGLILQRPARIDAAEALEGRLRAEPGEAERLWLANGDRVDGLFAGLAEREVGFQPPTGRVGFARSSVLALGFNPRLVSDKPPVGAFAEWTLVDGSRLTLGWDRTRFDRGQVVGWTRFGVEVRIPIGEVAQVRVGGSSVAYLSDREADRVVYESYLGPTRPYRRNASVGGGPIRLGGRTFDRGLGTQSRTLLLYKLDPSARRFQATIGLDDSAGPLGSVAFRVLVDGKAVFDGPSMKPGDPPRPVDVAVGGGKLLVLMTEFGERGDVQDSGDWAEARIIR